MKRIDNSDDKSSPPPTPPTEDMALPAAMLLTQMAFAHAKETNNLGNLSSLLKDFQPSSPFIKKIAVLLDTEKKAADQTVLIGDKLFSMKDIESQNKQLRDMVADTRV
ncbi:MAG: hypothetical protein K1060chlam4_01226 [Candidatus Anoxychlamydiales bacterium]|nr:hypothetical protein [Candidatus Anoxychlamydiales bacterium]